MKTTDPFDSIGKRTPYTLPENFFEQLQQNVWNEVAKSAATTKATETVAQTAAEATTGTVMGTATNANDEKTIPFSAPAKQRHNKVLRWISIALPAAAVMAGLAILPLHNTPKSQYAPTSQNLNTTEWIEQLSDEELESYCLFMDNDIFMEQ